MWIVELRQNCGFEENKSFAHLASTFDNAIAWIKEYGLEWEDTCSEYCFGVFEAVVDYDGAVDDNKETILVDAYGNVEESE